MSESDIPEDIRKRAELVYLALGRGSIADERAIARAILAERERAANIALAIDSGRGNEKQIAAAIRRPTGE